MIEEKSDVTNLHSGKVIAKNTLINLAGQVLPLFVGIVTIPLLIKGLGTERFGVLTLAWMVIGYFSLFDLGLGRALTQIIAMRLGKEEAIELPGLVWTGLAIMAVMGVIGALIAGSLSPLLIAKVFKMPDQLRPESLHAFYILSASIPIVILSSGFVGILTAYQRFDLINAVRIPLGLSNFIVPLLVLPFSTSLVPITLLLAVSRLASCVAQYWLCLRVMPSLRKGKRFIPEVTKPLLSFGGWMTVSNIVGPLMVYLDRFLIGAIVSVTAVAYYSTPYEIVTKLWLIPGALVGVLFPAFAASFVQDPQRAELLFARGVKYVLLILFPVTLIIITLAHEGLNLWLGREFAQHGTHVLQWLTVGVLFNSLAQIPFALVQGAGRPDLTARLHLIELPFYLLVVWWLIVSYGIEGAAIAWVLRVAVDTVFLFSMAYRLLLSSTAIIRRMILTVGVTLLILALAVLPNGIPMKGLFLLVTLPAFILVTWLFILTREERISVQSKLKIPVVS